MFNALERGENEERGVYGVHARPHVGVVIIRAAFCHCEAPSAPLANGHLQHILVGLEFHSMQTSRTPPLVLVIGGHDPSGGAGLQADIETLAAHGCRALSIVTALTTQNTCSVAQVQVQPASQVVSQCRLVLEESQVAAVKIGLLGSAQVARSVADLLREFTHLPMVLDPVLVAGSGKSLADAALRQAILNLLCPQCTLLTPNGPEARVLGGHRELERCAETLVAQGCAAVLITGGHEHGDTVINRLYGQTGLMQEYTWPRLLGSYHGSGCTLASAIAAGLACGRPLATTVHEAQAYTWESLNRAFNSGRCQLTPNRFHV